MALRTYAKPDVLVDPEWVRKNVEKPSVRVLECDADARLYEGGHIPGAVRLDWEEDLTDVETRDCIGPRQFEQLASRLGVAKGTQVVLYGDPDSMMACYAFWVFRMYGHEHLHLLNGGRAKWREKGFPLTREAPKVLPTSYKARDRQSGVRARRDDVFEHIGRPDPRGGRVRIPSGRALVDDRTPEEFRGEIRETADYPQRFLRGGHIPGAVNLPWRDLLYPDGTFKSAEDLFRIMEARKIGHDQDVIVYTRIGERASVSWFVFHELLGFKKVRTYDGSWTEWGNLVGMPIESATRPRATRQRPAYA